MPICKHEDFLIKMKHHKNLLGIDHGSKLIGIAISNKELFIATPLTTIVRNKQNVDFNEILKIIKEKDVGGIVVGLPLNMNGTKGPRSQSVETFFRNFLIFHDIPLLFQDERMSSQAIEKIFISQEISRKKRSSNID